MKNSQPAVIHKTSRISSIDVLRGCRMILLAGESCLLYTSLKERFPSGMASGIVDQFFHHPWHGLRFWDLVQPGFMLIAGIALYASWTNRADKGLSWTENGKHVLIRCLKLFIFGVGLHCVYAGKLVWELWNVLTQLSVTTIMAYLIIRKSASFQIVCSFSLLIFTELLYRLSDIPGFDQPFEPRHNFGVYMDLVMMGKANSDGWVAVNFIPTAAHTIWGVVCGKVLLSEISSARKLKMLVLAGIAGLVLGYGLDFYSISPIIKRISTSSFVLASGGWVVLGVALLYWLVDVKGKNRYAWLFTVVGMNALFIYLFFETVGVQWINQTVRIFVNGLSYLSVPDSWLGLVSAIVTLVLEWYICYWLHKRKIFFKL